MLTTARGSAAAEFDAACFILPTTAAASFLLKYAASFEPSPIMPGPFSGPPGGIFALFIPSSLRSSFAAFRCRYSISSCRPCSIMAAACFAKLPDLGPDRIEQVFQPFSFFRSGLPSLDKEGRRPFRLTGWFVSSSPLLRLFIDPGQRPVQPPVFREQPAGHALLAFNAVLVLFF